MNFQHLLIVVFLFTLSCCTKIPSNKLSQFELKEIGYQVHNDSLVIELKNPLNCPLRIYSSSANDSIQKVLNQNFPVVIMAKSDTVLSYWTDKPKDDIPIQFSAKFGDPNTPIRKKTINFPFRTGNSYQIIQGYNGRFSHTSTYSKYALDFNLSKGDTICAVADGFVVGVIQGYDKGGKSKKWRDYSNFITLFHPEMNLYTQYVHLTHNGSLVTVGDFVMAEQAIGLSGKTGQTDIEHLHFNVLKPNSTGMESVPIEFEQGYKGVDLKKGDWIKK